MAATPFSFTIEDLGKRIRSTRPDVPRRYGLDLEDSPMTDQELGRWAKSTWPDAYGQVYESPDPDIQEAAAYSNVIGLENRPQFARELSAAETAAAQEESVQSLLTPSTRPPLLPEGSHDFGGAVTSASLKARQPPSVDLTGSAAETSPSVEQPRPRPTLPVPGMPGIPSYQDPQATLESAKEIAEIPSNVPRFLSALDRNLAGLSREAGKEWMNVVESQGYPRTLPGAARQFIEKPPQVKLPSPPPPSPSPN
jgi:hypothetical protein